MRSVSQTESGRLLRFLQFRQRQMPADSNKQFLRRLLKFFPCFNQKTGFAEKS
jgi:hypothetical protein